MKRDKTNELAGQKATVFGLGMEGVDLVRYLTARGAEVTVRDTRDADRLTSSLNQLAGVRVHLALGTDAAAPVEDVDAIYLSQSVPLTLPAIATARAEGIPVRSMMQLFLAECRGTVVAVTGSSGKSTTTALLGEMFRESGRKMFVGGNIGVPLLSNLDQIEEDTWVVLEISHTQLLLTDRSPHIAAVTNVTPNHLDQFSWEQYVDLKRNMVRHQALDDIAVLNADNEVAASFAADTAGRKLYTSLDSRSDEAVYLEGDAVLARWDGSDRQLFGLGDIHLPGRHNIENCLTAAGAAVTAGSDAEAIRKAVQGFHGIAHRLELVRRVNGVGYYNDSIATAPERTIAGMRSFPDHPLILLLGGRHKNLPWEPLVAEVLTRCRAVVCFGEAGREIAEAITGAGFDAIETFDGLGDAVEAAARLAQSGDIVLLSPACTSFDAYANFEERGEHFRRLVRAIRETQ
ncbi:MAG: UDP-N-acetylmuramoyl-L-alanine--D-glutamate ligase [Dehalococcoidia bacterium]